MVLSSINRVSIESNAGFNRYNEKFLSTAVNRMIEIRVRKDLSGHPVHTDTTARLLPTGHSDCLQIVNVPRPRLD